MAFANPIAKNSTGLAVVSVLVKVEVLIPIG
jgi:hypothetical protein